MTEPQPMDDGYVDDPVLLRSSNGPVLVAGAVFVAVAGFVLTAQLPTPARVAVAVVIVAAGVVGFFVGGGVRARRVGGGVLLIEHGRPGRWRVVHRLAPEDIVDVALKEGTSGRHKSWRVVLTTTTGEISEILDRPEDGAALVRRLSRGR